jgi:ketosteroid isomerase-like protein
MELGARSMATSGGRLQADREAQFAQNLDAFVRRDFALIESAMRADVTLRLPGSSWLAGTYHGLEDVTQSIADIRSVFVSDRKAVTFVHQGDTMIVRHAITIGGDPQDEVEMTMYISITYDVDGRFKSIDVVPVDLGLFDFVVNSRPREAG